MSDLLPPQRLPRERVWAAQLPPHRASQAATSDDSNWLVEYALIARRYWILLAVTALLGSATGFGVMLFQPVIFQSTATLEVLGFNEAFMDAARVDPQGGIGNYGATLINMQTQLRLLRSSSLLQKVIQRVTAEGLNLSPVGRDRFSGLRDRLGIVPREPLEQGKKALEMALMTGSGRIIQGTRILEVTCESTSPEVASGFTNSWVNEYLQENLQTRLQSAQKTGQWLSAQLDETKAKLEKAERELQGYANRNGIPAQDQQSSLAGSRLQHLQLELASVQADRLAKQARLERVSRSGVDSLPDLALEGQLRSLQNQLAEAKAEMAKLALTLMPEHQRMKQVAVRVAGLEKSLATERETIAARIRAEYDSALQREKLLMAAYNRESGAVTDQTARAVDYNMLRREVDITRQQYNAMLQQSNQAAVVSAIPTNTVRVVDYSSPASRPIRPNAVIYTGWGLVSGLFLGFLFAVMRHGRDRSVRTPGVIPSVFRLPELAVIPEVKLQEPRRFALPLFRRTQAASAEPPALAVRTDGASVVAESFRFAATALMAEAADGCPPRVVVISSPGQGEGKTTVASNLAHILSTHWRRVLLIDADMRQPRLHQVFRHENTPGLSDLLNSDAPVESLDLSLYIRPGEQGPDVLPAGRPPADVGALLQSPRLGQMLARLRSRYDLVLIDTAPALLFSDSLVLGRLSDGAVLVMRSSVTSKDAVDVVRQRYDSNDVPLFGLILNQWKPGGADAWRYASSYYAQNG